MKFIIATWPHRSPVLFTYEDGQYKYYNEWDVWDSNLEDWDTSEATLHEVTL